MITRVHRTSSAYLSCEKQRSKFNAATRGVTGKFAAPRKYYRRADIRSAPKTRIAGGGGGVSDAGVVLDPSGPGTYANTKRDFREHALVRVQIVRRYALLEPIVGKPAIDPHTPHPPLSSLGRASRTAAVSGSPVTFRPQPGPSEHRRHNWKLPHCQTVLLRCATVIITVGMEISAQNAAPRIT